MTHAIYPITYKLTATHYNPGFFSEFFTVLGALDFYDKSTEDCTGLVVDFETKGLYYDAKHGYNWWNYYFEPIEFNVDKKNIKIFHDDKHSGFSIIAAHQMSVERGQELIKKYVKIKPHLQKKIDQFVSDHFKGHRVIGVHYRGTDKIIEAPKVGYDVLIKLLKAEEEKDKNIKIFVATDEEKFLEEMRKNFPGKILAVDAIRSANGYPVHYTSHRGAYNYKKGEDAVLDCMLLSKCAKLIRTSSNLSAASLRFNPSIEVTLLNRDIHEQPRAGQA